MPSAGGTPGQSSGQQGRPEDSQGGSAGEASAEHRPPWEKSGGEPGESGEGAPQDSVTLEDSEEKKAAAAAAAAQAEASADAAAAPSESQVLEDAVEAMKRKSAEASLDESAASGGAPAASAGAAAAPGSLEEIQQAVDAGASQGGSTAAGGSGREAERLNAELNASLGRFDGAMLGERDRVQAKAEDTGSGASQGESAGMLDPDAASGEDAAEGDYGRVSAGPAPEASAGKGGEATANDSSSGSGMSTIGGGSGRKGDYTHTAATNTPPPDIPDGSDDDVVARQIREAAMKEKDPELRDKLWDEYRKYVNSAKRKS